MVFLLAEEPLRVGTCLMRQRIPWERVLQRFGDEEANDWWLGLIRQGGCELLDSSLQECLDMSQS